MCSPYKDRELKFLRWTDDKTKDKTDDKPLKITKPLKMTDHRNRDYKC